VHDVLAKQNNPFGHSLERPDGHGCVHDEEASSKLTPQKYESDGTGSIDSSSSPDGTGSIDSFLSQRVYAKHP
jgi:hypothetical protein